MEEIIKSFLRCVDKIFKFYSPSCKLGDSFNKLTFSLVEVYLSDILRFNGEIIATRKISRRLDCDAKGIGIIYTTSVISQLPLATCHLHDL